MKRLEVLRNRHPESIIDSADIENATIGCGAKIEAQTRLMDVVVGDYASVLSGVTLQGCSISRFSYVSYHSRLVNCIVGKFCSVGPDVQIGLGPHPVRRFVSTYPAFYSPRNSGCSLSLRNDAVFDDSVPETVLGNDVWIGSNVIIPGGIVIGTGAVVAAGSVVVKDVPPYAIVGGNPAQLIRFRFDDATIAKLLESAWWDWPLSEIRDRLHEFLDAEQFVENATK